MTRTRTTALTGTLFLLAAAVALTLVFLTGRSSGGSQGQVKLGAAAGGLTGKEDTAGEGPANGFEAYMAAARTYPANTIPPAIVARAKATFGRIAKRDAKLRASLRARHIRGFLSEGPKWHRYGPRKYAVEPGVLAFTGAINVTASRTVALVADPDCSARRCRLWAGTSGGGVWRTNNVLAADPVWRQIAPKDLAQNSVGQLVLDPTDRHHDTLYLATGEGNRCQSGCEAGVGLYKSRDGGEHWRKLADRCVDNATYACVNPGKDAFLGRGINGVSIDPQNGRHIFVGSALGVRGLSHTIGNGGQFRFEPGANAPGLYESFDGGGAVSKVWEGGKPGPGGVTDVGLDPNNPSVVYAAAFDAGLWRRDAGSAQTAFQQVFAPQFAGQAAVPSDRTMFALTVENGHTRIYLTEGTANGAGTAGPLASNFWRTDMADQPA